MPKIPRRVQRELIDYLLDVVALRSKRFRRMSKRVLRAQRALRRLTDDEAWKAYLALEEQVNRRADEYTETVLRHALAFGATR